MNIYVGNLSDDITKTDLKNAFKEYGKVTSVKLKKDLYTKKTKGYGFVLMLDDEKASEAIKKLDGSDLKGQKIKVSKYRSDTQSWKKSQKHGSGPPF